MEIPGIQKVKAVNDSLDRPYSVESALAGYAVDKASKRPYLFSGTLEKEMRLKTPRHARSQVW